jgi:truncated hemoglobin YjbI
MGKAVKLYRAIGEASGCRALATAFYAQVARDPILRPLFPSTFKCAIEEFSAFLVQFLGGEADATQHRWWLSLRESHDRFAIGQRERNAWLRAMTLTLDDESLIADAGVRAELIAFFTQSSAYVINKEPVPASTQPLTGELAPLWNEQLALDEVVALARTPDKSEQCIELLEGPTLRDRFARSPAVHASVVALAATSGIPMLREWALNQLRANPALARERYKGWRTLLHDASGAGDVSLVEQLLDMGAGDSVADDKARTPLYCVGNECSAPGASQIVRALLRKNPACVDVIHGVKRCTALHMAARRGNVEVIGALLDGGADIEARDSAGDTPLRRSVNCNKVDAARLLLARGADPHSRGSKQLTPAGAARSSQMKQLLGD